MPRNKSISQQIRQESRNQILSAARFLFAERGYPQTKVSDIARETGMSQGNLYWYFSSKEDLLKAVLQDGFESFAAVLEKAAAHPGSAIHKLDSLLDDYLHFARERGDFFRIFIALLAQGGTDHMKKLGFDTGQIGIRYHQYLQAILAQGQAEGVLSGDIPVGLLVSFYFSFFNGLLITYGADWQNLPPDQIRNAVLRLIGANSKPITGGEE